MKKLTLLALMLTATLAASGQGILIFANSSTTGITNSVTGLGAPGTALDQTDTQVGLYVGNVGDSVGSLNILALTNFAGPGQFRGGNRTLTGFAAGATVQVQIRAWFASTVYPTYEAAYAAAIGGDASVLLGVSNPFNIVLVNSSTPANSTAGLLQPFNISPVPEPSSIALGLLGLGAVALFRRRK
jgi:hypothetical protein